MQVLVTLADAEGSVVTRDTLFRRCWGGVYVGDDSLNRAISGVRRVAATVGAGTLNIETITRTGYRLVVREQSNDLRPEKEDSNAAKLRALSAVAPTRRQMLIGGSAAAIFGLGALTLLGRADDPHTEQVIDRSRRTLLSELPNGGESAAALLEGVVRRDPQKAEAWGLLALAYRDVAEGAAPAETAAAIDLSAHAVRQALRIAPREENALTALAMLRPYFGDWAAAEQRLVNVLRVAPDNIFAINSIVAFLQGVGRAKLSYAWNERALKIDPNLVVPSYRRAIKLWQLNQLDEADQAIDRTMQLWPKCPAVWNARMMIFAYTGRASAGLAFLNEVASRPETLSRTAVELWRISLQALASGSSRDVTAARAANLSLAPRSPGFANNAIMTLSALGELDAAFDVAFGTFLRRGPLIGTLWGGAGEMPVNTLRWRRPVALFIPATARLRADPRFTELCKGMGLTRYWRERRITPDYQLGQPRTSVR
jgi:DNA-binding winged helix-turn-helix (wHTH) protein/Tfp pilus assembly protein PilF